MRRALLFTLLTPFACGGPAKDADAPKAAPAASSETVSDPAGAGDTGEMSLEQAEQVLARFERDHPAPADEPLRTPKSLDDVLSILKRDQMDLFGAGVAFAAQSKDPEAKALEGQIELAWGDACVLLADILWEKAAQERTHYRRLQVKLAAGSAADGVRAELAVSGAAISRSTTAAAALMRVATEHLAHGSEIARAIIAARPGDYVGYRVAADYYRLRGDWEAFDTMVRQIEAQNPDSVGLRFLRGVAAADRDRDPVKGAEHLHEALTLDPQFTRAQAQLVVWASDVAAQEDALAGLAALNPHHHMVVWSAH